MVLIIMVLVSIGSPDRGLNLKVSQNFSVRDFPLCGGCRYSLEMGRKPASSSTSEERQSLDSPLWLQSSIPLCGAGRGDSFKGGL